MCREVVFRGGERWGGGKRELCKSCSELQLPTWQSSVSWHRRLLLVFQLVRCSHVVTRDAVDVCMASVMRVAAELPRKGRRADSQRLLAFCAGSSQQMSRLLSPPPSPSLGLRLESAQNKPRGPPGDVLRCRACQIAGRHGVNAAIERTAGWRHPVVVGRHGARWQGLGWMGFHMMGRFDCKGGSREMPRASLSSSGPGAGLCCAPVKLAVIG